MSQFDTVTITYKGELPLLDLQARSFRLVDPAIVGTIFIAVNDKAFAECEDHIEKVTRPLFGPLSGKVRVVSASEAGARTRIGGWFMQQALKLVLSRFCTSPYMLILDSKIHFVRPIDATTFVMPDGRPKVSVKPRVGQSRQREWLVDSLAYFNHDPSLCELPAPPSNPPYCVWTADVRELVDVLEERGGKTVFDVFAERKSKITEFLLIYSYQLKKYHNYESRMAPGSRPHYCFFRTSPTGARRGEFLASVERGESPTFGVHRDRFCQLTPVERRRVAAVWADAGLFQSLAEATEEMDRLIATYPATVFKGRLLGPAAEDLLQMPGDQTALDMSADPEGGLGLPSDQSPSER